MSDLPIHQRKGSILGTVKAVLWGFLGVRRQADYQKDIASLNPVHIIVVGILMALLFVVGLIGLVNWVVR